MSLTVRAALLSELPILLEFEQGIIKAERPFDPSLGENPISYYDLKALILSDNAYVMVAEIKGEIVASAYAKIVDSLPYLKFKQHVYLGFMFTKPNFRGQGINSKIIESCKDWTIQKGLKEMRLEVYHNNDSAVKAYKKAGFEKNLVLMRMEIEH